MSPVLTEASPSTRGRILATLFLFVTACGLVGQTMIAERLIVYGDAAATVANIAANRSLYRLAFTLFMIEMAAQLVVSMMFYDLLKPVNRSIARASLILGLTGGGIKTMARLFYYAPLLVVSAAESAAFQPAQLEALVLALIRINDQGAAIGLAFFGFENLLQGWLLFRSGFLPRFLGVISMIAGIGWLTWVWPPLGSQTFIPTALFAIVGIMATAGWLYIRGVDDTKWKERAALAATSIWR